MAPTKSLWAQIIHIYDFIIGFSITRNSYDLQIPVQTVSSQPPNYPVWTPPDDLEDPTFQCEYPSLLAEDGWIMCNSNSNRQCWLNNTKTSQTYDITTDYENDGPKGILRNYYLELTETLLNPDDYTGGPVFAQVFNGTLPGPRIQACWGDQIAVTIKNSLSANGTTIHWHGIRQWNTGWNDGVNAITSCPIPPGESFTYVFNATQYGTSWYHSHYSLQYAAGLLGPLTLYGPVSGNYDHQVSPILMSDWKHSSVYAGGGPDNVLQNGIGHWSQLEIDLQHFQSTDAPRFNELVFQRGVSYLIRLVNGAADTSFVFAIDGHKFKVVSADFVAITPYDADHINVGIGQRYNIIVVADPSPISLDGNYWIRTVPAQGCSGLNGSTDGRTGIVRYSPNTALPTTNSSGFSVDCSDETYNKTLTPIFPWTVDASSMLDMAQFNLFGHTITNQSCPYQPCGQTKFHFELVPSHPMWLNFSNATLLNLNQDFSLKPWLAEINTDTGNEQWVKITIVSGKKQSKSRLGSPAVPNPGKAPPDLNIPNYHPMHLHGHDFAVLAQCVPASSDQPCDVNEATLNTKNPPRRDVAFLPDGGYLVLAFKPDNPGVWLLHCHIAAHASLGLAAQIIENKEKIDQVFHFGWDEALLDQCSDWAKYCASDDACESCFLQNDSGI